MLLNGNGPGVYIPVIGPQVDQVASAAQIFHHILPSGQGGPGLNANVGRIGLGPMPEADIRHIREGYAYGSPVPGAEGHLTVHILQDNGILIKELVTKSDATVVLQKVGLCLPVYKQLGRKTDPIRLAGLGKFQGIIFKGFSIQEGDPETGMTANGKIQGFCPLIMYPVGNLHSRAVECIDDLKYKIEGVLGQGFQIAFQLQDQMAIATLCHGKLRACGKAVDPKGIFFVLYPIFTIIEPADHRKKSGRPIRPVGGIALPKILTSIGRPQTQHLCAQGIYCQGQEFVLNGNFHSYLLIRDQDESLFIVYLLAE